MVKVCDKGDVEFFIAKKMIFLIPVQLSEIPDLFFGFLRTDTTVYNFAVPVDDDYTGIINSCDRIIINDFQELRVYTFYFKEHGSGIDGFIP
jgi:hypothetical protein